MSKNSEKKNIELGCIIKYPAGDENWADVRNVERVKQCAWNGNGSLTIPHWLFLLQFEDFLLF